MKNAIFGLKKRQDFWTEIIFFSMFQVIVDPPGIAAVTRSKREIGGGRGRISEFMEDFQENVRPLWSSLTPDVFTCSASVVGCDFCIYYLATYNLTAPPAACIGGCSLSTFSSCSKLVAKSLVQTIELQKTIGWKIKFFRENACVFENEFLVIIVVY